MTKVLTYRGTERITPEQVADLRKYFGDEKRSPYHWIIEKEIDQNYDTFVHELVELFATIQCDRNLNERETQIRERIAKGLTPSRARHYEFVEQGLVEKLVNDAKNLFKKEQGNELTTHPYWSEIYRYFGLPLPKIKFVQDIAKAKEKTANVFKPKKFYKWKSDGKTGYSQDSAYKLYHVKVKEFSAHHSDIHEIYKKFDFVGKIYHVWSEYSHNWSKDRKKKEKYLQIYVYDLAHRNWAVQIVLNELIKRKFLSVKDLKV